MTITSLYAFFSTFVADWCHQDIYMTIKQQAKLTMKRIIFILITAAFAVSGVQAQSALKKGFNNFKSLIVQHEKPTGVHDTWDLYAGLKVGINGSRFMGANGKFKPGFYVGATVETFFHPQWGIDFEIGYSHQGAKGISAVTNSHSTFRTALEREEGAEHITIYHDCTRDSHTTGTYDVNLDYLNTTYLIRWYPKRHLPLSVYTGVHVYRIIHSSMHLRGERTQTVSDLVDGTSTTDTYAVDAKEKINDDLHRGDVAIPLGVSYEVGQWQFDARYNFSFRHLAKSNRMKQILGNGTNSLVMLSAAYRIHFF